MIITDILAAITVYKVAYMLFPVPEPICYQYEGVLRILLNYDLLLFVLLLSLAVGGDSTRYALGYAYLFVRRVVLLAWEWVILPCLASASRCCVRLLWPTKGQVQPVAPVFLPASELMLPALSSVASPPASSLLADAVSPAGVLPAVAFPAALVPFERPFLQPPAPATPHPVASCAACAEFQASLTPATSDVPVAAPSSGWDFVSAAPVSPAFSVPTAASVGSSAVPAATDVPVATPSSAALVVPAAPTATNVVFVPAVVDAAVTEDLPAPVPSAASALPVAVASVPAPAPVLSAVSDLPVAVASVPAPAPSTSFGRGVRFVVSRGGDVARRAAVHAHKKVGKTTPPSELRRAARAALTAGVVKPAPFCFPVVGAAAAAASSAVSCVGTWLLASARTVKVARKPARRIVSVRRLLRPAVRKEILEQKAAIVVRRRVTAARRRAVAAWLAVFSRRAAAAAVAVVARSAPAFLFGGIAPSVPAFSSAGVVSWSLASEVFTVAPALSVALFAPPAAPRASLASRGERLLVPRGRRVRLGACGGICAGVARAVVKAVHTHKKVGNFKPPCALRRVARAALAAGAVKTAPFRFPVAPALSSGVGMAWMASEVLTVAPALSVALFVPPAAPRASLASRGERLLVPRGRRVRLGACAGVWAGAARGVVKAVHTHKKVGKIKPPCALRRVARAALTAGALKPAPFRFPVAVLPFSGVGPVAAGTLSSCPPAGNSVGFAVPVPGPVHSSVSSSNCPVPLSSRRIAIPRRRLHRMEDN